jgi:hypothetical protein
MKAVTYPTRRSLLASGTLALVGSSVLARARWAEESQLPAVREVTLSHPLLPREFSGLRIAQVADLHAGMFMPPERLAQVRDVVEALQPDLIALTGDQLDRREVDAEFFVHGLAGITAPLGAYGVLGNHDHMAGARLARAAIEAVGVVPLVNGGVTLQRHGARVRLAGVDDLDGGPGWGPDFAVASRPDEFCLLLCHQPNGWRSARAAGANIMLAGHTHGGQIALPSRGVNLARLATPYIAGPYFKAGQILYVSRGIGVGAVPLRFGVPPEIDLITLRRGPLASW